MPTRLQSICDTILEATWLAALIITPLFFNVYSQRVFEPDKISLLRSLALIALITYIVKKVAGIQFRGGDEVAAKEEVSAESWWRKPLVLPVLILAAAYLISTVFSVAPRQSFWGSYQRLQGTFTMLSYMVFFFVALDTLRTRKQWQRLQYTVILTSLPIALYGILQHFELDPLPWGGKTTERVTGNLGNSIFLAAYLIMALPLTFERLITAVRRILLDEDGNTADALVAGALLFVVIVQAVGIIFTQSRGPWLGLGTGTYVFLLLALTTLRQQATDKQRLRLIEVGKGISVGLAGVFLILFGVYAFIQGAGIVGGIAVFFSIIGFLALYLAPILTRRGWRWLWLSIITQAAAAVILLGILNLPNTPLSQFKEIPYAGRLAEITQTSSGTGRVRVLIWQGVLDMLGSNDALAFPDGSNDSLEPVRTLIGYGPESMWVAYNRYYKPELGGLEQRNASPDRSHNETFDSLVITGVLGFLAYILLFGSVFYYALRWLGLIRSNRDRNLFIVLGGLGLLVGILVPWLLGVFHFAGTGVAIGFVFGVLLYITYAAVRGGDSEQQFDRRHLIIIALLATVVSHFVEIHFGISIAATRSYFFIFIAALSAIGIEQVRLVEEAPIDRATIPEQRSSGKRRKRRSSRTATQTSTVRRSPALWRRILPYAMISSVILLVLNFDFVSNQLRETGLFSIFWQSWVTHLNGGEVVQGPGALWVVLFAIIVGLVMALGEAWSQRQTNKDVLVAAVAYLGVTLFIWLFVGLIQATRVQPLPPELSNIAQASHLAGHIVNFYIWLGILVLLLAGSLIQIAPRSSKSWGRQPVLAVATGAVLLVVAFFIIVNVNINLVRADVFFKLGQNSDNRREWRLSLDFYDEASKLTPNEDHYQLFRGRALLMSARAAGDSIQQTVLLDRAEEVLQHARDLNPLNTDHTANLARYYAARASTQTDETARRDSFEKAAEAYMHATNLSPNAAHLQNEWGTIYLELQESDKARERFTYSLGLDANYHDTYLRLAQLESGAENWEEAIDNFRKVIELRPQEMRAYSGLSFVLDKVGRTEEALEVNLEALVITPNNLNILQNLALIYQKLERYEQALIYAERAHSLTPEDQQAAINALIRELQQRNGQD